MSDFESGDLTHSERPEERRPVHRRIGHHIKRITEFLKTVRQFVVSVVALVALILSIVNRCDIWQLIADPCDGMSAVIRGVQQRAGNQPGEMELLVVGKSSFRKSCRQVALMSRRAGVVGWVVEDVVPIQEKGGWAAQVRVNQGDRSITLQAFPIAEPSEFPPEHVFVVLPKENIGIPTPPREVPLQGRRPS